MRPIGSGTSSANTKAWCAAVLNTAPRDESGKRASAEKEREPDDRERRRQHKSERLEQGRAMDEAHDCCADPRPIPAPGPCGVVTRTPDEERSCREHSREQQWRGFSARADRQ